MALPGRQKMLKDFLMEADLHSFSSREFFRSLPRQKFDSTMKELMTLELRPSAATSSRNSKTRSTTMSALHTMVKIVKAIPKTLSKQRSGKTVERDEGDVKMAVTVKDIIGWRSFRENVVVQDSEQPPSPEGCTAVTTTTISTTSSSSSKGSSWCDSDFTAEYSPPWCGNNAGNDILEAKPGETYSPNYYVGKDYAEMRERSFSAMETEPELKEQQEQEEEDQQSYDPEYKAVRLLNEVRTSIPSNDNINDNVDSVLLDFFRIELREMRFRSKFHESGSDHHLSKTAMSWLEGDYDSSSYEWGVEKKRVGYMRDMDRERWGESKEERDEVAEEIEGEVLSLLVHELAVEILEA